MKKEDIKPAAWGAVCGAVALLIVIFSTGWVVTSNSAQDMARQMAQQAVIASLTPICVAQFSEGANGEGSLAQMKALDSWKRPEFVVAKGWATMPGSDKASSEIASECADRLMRIAS